MKLSWLCAGLLALSGLVGGDVLAADSEMPSLQFLNTARHPHNRECWTRLDGKVTHMRRGEMPRETTIRLGILFTPQRTLTQIVIGGSEGYLVGQGFDAGQEKTSIIPRRKDGYKDPVLGQFGLRPEDLALSFIFWTFLKELPRDAVKGHECRVFLLNAPAEAGRKEELVKVYLSSKYYFPLKVEWFQEPQETPYRTLEISSFREVKEIWVPDSIGLYGPGWRTKVEFNKADAGQKDTAPRDLFLPQE